MAKSKTKSVKIIVLICLCLAPLAYMLLPYAVLKIKLSYLNKYLHNKYSNISITPHTYKRKSPNYEDYVDIDGIRFYEVLKDYDTDRNLDQTELYIFQHRADENSSIQLGAKEKTDYMIQFLSKDEHIHDLLKPDRFTNDYDFYVDLLKVTNKDLKPTFNLKKQKEIFARIMFKSTTCAGYDDFKLIDNGSFHAVVKINKTIASISIIDKESSRAAMVVLRNNINDVYIYKIIDSIEFLSL